MTAKVALLVLSSVGFVRSAEYIIRWDTIVPLGQAPTIFPGSHPIGKRPAYTEEELEHCRQLEGRYMNGKFEGIKPKCNVSRILGVIGGQPGELKLDKSRIKEVSEVPAPRDPQKRPLDDSPEQYWQYNEAFTDYSTYYRKEHLITRFKGTPQEFQDIRGEILWTPADFCGFSRQASYVKDDTGFHADVSDAYCYVGSSGGYIVCYTPSTCKTEQVEGGTETISCLG